MALIDHEAVLTDLEAHFLSRNSHGQRDLLRTLAELRQKHRLEEPLAARYLRLAEPLDTEPTEGDREPVGAHGSG